MSSYVNPQVPHEVNVSRESLLWSFIKLGLATIAFIIALGIAVYFGMRWAVHFIPFSTEVAITEPWISSSPFGSDAKGSAYLAAQQKLQQLAENLAQAMNAPPDMPVHIHLLDDSIPNAMTTLGGHIMITTELIKHVHSENALAMVIAHELAHAKNRDPLTALGSGVIASILLTVVTGSGDTVAPSFIGNLTQLTFSRRQERKADADALQALQTYYGHTQGAEEFFEYILKENGSEGLEFFQTHPDTLKRLSLILDSQHGFANDLTPLPEDIEQIQRRH